MPGLDLPNELRDLPSLVRPHTPNGPDALELRAPGATAAAAQAVVQADVLLRFIGTLTLELSAGRRGPPNPAFDPAEFLRTRPKRAEKAPHCGHRRQPSPTRPEQPIDQRTQPTTERGASQLRRSRNSRSNYVKDNDELSKAPASVKEEEVQSW